MYCLRIVMIYSIDIFNVCEVFYDYIDELCLFVIGFFYVLVKYCNVCSFCFIYLSFMYVYL